MACRFCHAEDVEVLEYIETETGYYRLWGCPHCGSTWRENC